MRLKPGRLHHPINDPPFVERWYTNAGLHLALCRHCGDELQVYDEHGKIWYDGFAERYCDVDETQVHEPMDRPLCKATREFDPDDGPCTCSHPPNHRPPYINGGRPHTCRCGRSWYG